MKYNFHYADFHEIRNNSLILFLYNLKNFIQTGREVYEKVKVKLKATLQQTTKAQRGSTLLFL